MERSTFISIELDGQTFSVGQLWSHVRRGRESATFEYDPDWLASPQRFALEPGLMLTPGSFHTREGKSLFGALGDSAPDRWGRMLLRRTERLRATREGTAPRTLFEIDFLLAVDDEGRAGALRFSGAKGGPYLAHPGERRTPPLINLPRLLSAAERVAADTDTEEDLRLLIAPGTSLGGARPKASVRDDDGQLAIAKFPHKDDTVDTVAWEAMALALARAAGIDVAECRVIRPAEKAVLLLRRFDRNEGHRMPLLSAMSMLGASDNDPEPHSYLEIADAIRQHGAAPKTDLVELWRRMVFNVMISNTDDHLRNHAFLYETGKGWRLSPAYDLNPTPTDIRPRLLSTVIADGDPSASLDLALANAEYFGLKPAAARSIARDIAMATKDWRSVAGEFGLGAGACDRLASAFEHEDLAKALR